MPRRKRVATGGFVYHVINRAVAREKIFRKTADYQAFEQVLEDAQDRLSIRLLSFCVMPNHWHLVVWPRQDGDLSEYLRWLTVTHTKRWHSHHRTIGTGALYQGRFKSFPVQTDEHFLTVCRYVERNALRANLVERAEQWRWSSLWHRERHSTAVSLSAWPVSSGRSWLKLVNRVETEVELQALRAAVKRGAPFGEAEWQEKTAGMLSLESSLRPRGRPRLPKDNMTSK
jgi:REP-associated tyrosine transposase